MVGLLDDYSIDDIEDLSKTFNIEGAAREKSKKDLPPRAKKLKGKDNAWMDERAPEADSIIPGTQKIYVKTWGCSHNNSDSEYMAGQLASFGYKITGRYLSQAGKHTSTCIPVWRAWLNLTRSRACKVKMGVAWREHLILSGAPSCFR